MPLVEWWLLVGTWAFPQTPCIVVIVGLLGRASAPQSIEARLFYSAGSSASSVTFTGSPKASNTGDTKEPSVARLCLLSMSTNFVARYNRAQFSELLISLSICSSTKNMSREPTPILRKSRGTKRRLGLPSPRRARSYLSISQRQF
jgi:hypothetical protein